jgi:hypothetical protein
VQFALTVPPIRDRVAQTAAKLVLEPIFEADFEDCAYGYRPRRSGVEAVNEVRRLIPAYFSHGTRMKAYRVVGNHVEQSVRHFLRRRHKVQTQGLRRFSRVELCKTYVVLCLRQMHLELLPLRTLAWTELPNDMR